MMGTARTCGTLVEAVVCLPLTGCTSDPSGRPGWVAAASAGLNRVHAYTEDKGVSRSPSLPAPKSYGEVWWLSTVRLALGAVS